MEKERIYCLTKKDFVIQTFRCGGHGGQNVNKRDTGVRITHPESGAVGQSCDERMQLPNKKIAFRRMLDHPKFKIWHARKVAEYYKGKHWVEKEVDRLMNPKFIKTEIKNDAGNWMEVPYDCQFEETE